VNACVRARASGGCLGKYSMRAHRLSGVAACAPHLCAFCARWSSPKIPPNSGANTYGCCFNTVVHTLTHICTCVRVWTQSKQTNITAHNVCVKCASQTAHKRFIVSLGCWPDSTSECPHAFAARSARCVYTFKKLRVHVTGVQMCVSHSR
jgi:hypothetical protein